MRTSAELGTRARARATREMEIAETWANSAAYSVVGTHLRSGGIGGAWKDRALTDTRRVSPGRIPGLRVNPSKFDDDVTYVSALRFDSIGARVGGSAVRRRSVDDEIMVSGYQEQDTSLHKRSATRVNEVPRGPPLL